jgi:hypothetical protein
MPRGDFCEFKKTLQSSLPFSLCTVDRRCPCSEEVSFARARRSVQRLNDHIGQNAVNGHAGLLRMQEQLVSVEAAYVELRCIPDS